MAHTKARGLGLPPRQTALFAVCLLALLAVAGLAGCGRSPDETPVATASAGSPTATPEASAQRAETVNGTDGSTLQIWLPPHIATATTSSTAGARLLVDVLVERAQLSPELSTASTIKALQGSSGLRESILATAPVAPERMPHLALIDATDLPALVAAGLVQPISDETILGRIDTLWPSAMAAVTIDDRLYGVPFCIDLLVMVYDRERVASPPGSWEELVSGSSELVLPGARGAPAADTLLAHYLSQGALVQGAQPVLDTAALSRALSAYQLAIRSGTMAKESASLEDFEQTWVAYASGDVDLAATTTAQLLKEGSSSDTGVSSLPVSGSQAVVLGRVLAWVVLTKDRELADTAYQVIDASLQLELQRMMVERTFHLPVISQAMDAPAVMPWRGEIERLLNRARPMPGIEAYASFEAALGGAVASVVDGSSSPAAAASLAAARLQQ